jgi:DNA-binding beta-propeller fold protein YncE
MKRSILFLVMLAIFLPAVAHSFKADGFSNPYGVVVDSKSNYIYVSNVNGNQSARDDNGFISRLNGDGTIDKLRFIDGASRRIKLDAPKGMAIVVSALYVADVGKVRVFDLRNGRFVYNINFGDLPIQHFYDIELGPDGALYVVDGPGNAIYRVDVDKQHEVTKFASGPHFGQPHGIAWLPERQIFAVAGWSSGQIDFLDRSGRRQPKPTFFLKTLEGITADSTGNAYVSSTSLGSVFKIAPNFALFDYLLGQVSPAGLAYHAAEKSIITTSFSTGVVASYPIDPPQPVKRPVAPQNLL